MTSLLRRPARLWIVLSFTLGLFPFLFAARPLAQPGGLEGVSVAVGGGWGNAESLAPALSADGRFVAFASFADNLVPEDTNGAADIFVYDRVSGQLELASPGLGGEPANGPSTNPALSGDGRFVAFESLAANLVPGDTNQAQDIFIYDRLTGQTALVSAAGDGEQADAGSASPALSFSGRYAAFFSAATNLVYGDTNGVWDVFIKDLVTGAVTRASVNSAGEQGNAPSGPALSISADGRWVAFASEASNLAPDDLNGARDVFLYQRVLKQTTRLPLEKLGGSGALWADLPLLSAGGGRVALVVGALTLDRQGNLLGGLYLYDREQDVFSRVELPEGAVTRGLALSADGQTLVYLDETAEQPVGMVYRQGSGERLPLLVGAQPAGLAVSADGQVFAFATVVEGVRQVVVLPVAEPAAQPVALSGRVTDAEGRPLALATIADAQGNTTQTDAQGYFYWPAAAGQNLNFTPQKDGYTFTPANRPVTAAADQTGLDFVVFPQSVLDQARLNLGMPYSFDRGCPNPFEGCGGPFSGFYAGYCTDLILDAAAAGLDYFIQQELESAARANPVHFYRWRNARNAHDMWRFFSYTGQILPHTAGYQPGDFVFFDWSGDGEIDHVAIVSDVNETLRPTWLLDATGVTPYNPGGLAAELPWQAEFEDTVRGHARWSGVYQPYTPEFAPGVQVFQMALSGAGVQLRLVAPDGAARSVAENSLRTAAFFDLQWEQTISILNPSIEAGAAAPCCYVAEISTLAADPARFQFTVQSLQDGLVTQRYFLAGQVAPGEVRRVPLKLFRDGEQLTFLSVNYLVQLKVRGLLEK